MMGYSLTLVPGISSSPSASSALDAAASGAAPTSPAAPPPSAWHPHKPTLAVSDSAGRLRIYDMSGAESGPGPNGTTKPASGRAAAPTPKLVLSHRLQTQVRHGANCQHAQHGPLCGIVMRGCWLQITRNWSSGGWLQLVMSAAVLLAPSCRCMRLHGAPPQESCWLRAAAVRCACGPWAEGARGRLCPRAWLAA
jgi:hypothetical protein